MEQYYLLIVFLFLLVFIRLPYIFKKYACMLCFFVIKYLRYEKYTHYELIYLVPDGDKCSK